MENEVYVVLRTMIQDDPQIIKIGTEVECKSYLFDKTIPKSYRRNIVNVDTEYSYVCISLEELTGGEWIKKVYSLQKYNEGF